MAKKSNQEPGVEEGKTRLYLTGPAGGHKDFDKAHANRILKLEAEMGVQNYVLQSPDGETEPGGDTSQVGEA